MKKTVMALGAAALLTTAAQADLFLGVDMINGDSMTYETESENYGTTYKSESDVDGFKINLGAGDPKSTSFNLYYSMLEQEYGSEINEFGFEVRPYINFGNDFGIYFEGGLGYGQMDIKGTSLAYSTGETTRDYLGANVGVGVSYLLANQVEFNIGYAYKFQVWQDIEQSSYYTTDTLTTTATGGGIYFGARFYFGKVGNTTQAMPASYRQSTPAPAQSSDQIAY